MFVKIMSLAPETWDNQNMTRRGQIDGIKQDAALRAYLFCMCYSENKSAESFNPTIK